METEMVLPNFIMEKNMETYFIINVSEDGPSIYSLSEDALLAEIKEREEGGEEIIFIDNVTDFDLEGRSGMIIIKGKIIVPKPVEIVKSYSLG